MRYFSRLTPACFVIIGIVLLTNFSNAASTRSLSPEEQKSETLLGQAEAAAFIQSQVLLIAPKLQAKCQSIANKLLYAAGSKEKCNVYIVNAPLAKAFTLPCGDIFLYTGLLDELSNTDELAAVLAHEISHYLNHDATTVLKKYIKSRKIAANTAALLGAAAAGTANLAFGKALPTQSVKSTGTSGRGSGGGQIAVFSNTNFALNEVFNRVALPKAINKMYGPVANSLGEILGSGYGEKLELRADRDGIEYTRRAGFDPTATAKVLKRLQQMQAKQNQIQKSQ